MTDVPSQLITDTPSQLITDTPSQLITDTPSQIFTDTPSQIFTDTPTEHPSNEPTDSSEPSIFLVPTEVIVQSPVSQTPNISNGTDVIPALFRVESDGLSTGTVVVVVVVRRRCYGCG